MYDTLISTADLAAHLEDPSFVVVDVRHDLTKDTSWGEEQYRAGHIPGARFAHVDRDLSAPMTGRNGRHPLPAPADAAASLGKLGIDNDKQVIAYDQAGGLFAVRLWWMLRWLGHDKAAVLDGGYARWTSEGRPVETSVPTVTPATFTPVRVRPTVSSTGVMASLPRHTLLLLDARAAERFRGETEPFDPVAGHLPGALNRPATRNLTPAGTFRPARELRAEFDAMLHGRAVDDVVHYCGSGVNACHNVLAMAVAGYPITRIYPGSWSEWVSDRSRPVATGPV